MQQLNEETTLNFNLYHRFNNINHTKQKPIKSYRLSDSHKYEGHHLPRCSHWLFYTLHMIYDIWQVTMTCYIWYMTSYNDIWHVTDDIWHVTDVTDDIWHVTDHIWQVTSYIWERYKNVKVSFRFRIWILGPQQPKLFFYFFLQILVEYHLLRPKLII